MVDHVLFANRHKKIIDRMSAEGLDGFITFTKENIRYLSGFTGSSAVLIVTPEKVFFFTDFRYKQQSELQVGNCEVIIYKEQKKVVADYINSLRLKCLGFESQYLSYHNYCWLKESIKCRSFEPVLGIVEKIRLIKEPCEIESIKKSADIMIRSLEEIKKVLHEKGLSELAVAAKLEYIQKRNGSEAVAFNSIVVSGKRSAMPHATPCNNVLKDKDFLVIDCGARYDGYNSDMTRTFLLGECSNEQEKIYNIVLDANKNAINAVKPGIKASVIDKAARDLIDEAGYKEYFGHGTGHGVGLFIHEDPSIKHDSETIIEEGMVFTIEPGIYISGLGGVRIEDMVVVTKDGCEVITRSLDKGLSHCL